MTSSQVIVSQPSPTRKRLRRRLGTVLRYIPLFFLLFVFTFPLVFMIVSSFKTSNVQVFSDLRSVRAFLPVGDLTLDNYKIVFQNSNFPRYLFNSAMISIVTIFLALAVNSMAAYSLSRLKWRGQKLILSVIIATLIIPGQATMMPLLLLVSRLPNFSISEGFTTGWLDSYQVLIVPAIVSAITIFLFYQFFQDIPKELDEAAMVDGASRFQIFYKIVVPISGPVFATVAILTFIASWNMFLWPIMTIQSDELRPVMVGLLFFFQRDTQWPQIMAYSTMIVIPVLAFFFAFQNAFVKSVATSGLKG
ncbi:MAG: carbohydrate ABC transporter permease [Anaerolineales bacterium]|nr:carbohydrate ABC transporter permease [Anaerolineales bacterium]